MLRTASDASLGGAPEPGVSAGDTAAHCGMAAWLLRPFHRAVSQRAAVLEFRGAGKELRSASSPPLHFQLKTTHQGPAAEAVDLHLWMVKAVTALSLNA